MPTRGTGRVRTRATAPGRLHGICDSLHFKAVHNATIDRGEGAVVVRRSLCAALVTFLTLALAPAAFAVPDGQQFAPFEHDSSRDGTPNEIRSGFYGGDDSNNANGDPLQDRVQNSYESFEFRAESGH